jgi:hypothetical protein
MISSYPSVFGENPVKSMGDSEDERGYESDRKKGELRRTWIIAIGTPLSFKSYPNKCPIIFPAALDP